jgi:hypothetical protein
MRERVHYKSNRIKKIQKTKEVTKSARRMPRLLQAKKDAISCDKLRGGANDRQSADFRMGEPFMLKA